jgi:hypothetical protein
MPVPFSTDKAIIGPYYLTEVIGGPGAFVIEADGFPAFGEAVRRKLVREVAGTRHWYEDHYQRKEGGNRSILHGSPTILRFQWGSSGHGDRRAIQG